MIIIILSFDIVPIDIDIEKCVCGIDIDIESHSLLVC